MSAFELDAARPAPDAMLVGIRGTLDVREAIELREALVGVVGDAVRVVVDAGDADVRDSGVVSALYDLALHLRERDGVLAVAAPTDGALHRVVRLSGLTQAFQLYPSRTAALDDLGLDDVGVG